MKATIYEPENDTLPRINLFELWDYRELIYFLTLRDIQIRYKQTILGIAWAVLQPLLSMIIFSLVFGHLAKLPSDGPYPVFAFAGLLPWQLFAGALSRAGSSLVTNRNLLTKVYFPRIVIPISATLAGLVDFAISFVFLIILMAIYGIHLTTAIMALPLLILLALLTALGVGLWISALNVQYRDFEHALPFMIQAWMYASPVVYSTSLIPKGIWQILYGLNPLAGVIQGFRWSLLGGEPPSGLFWVSVLVVFLIIISGLIYFRRMEDNFADII
ncbi:MAG TPA: ABC transporter permease [Anaerolineaceae bacterium]|nr:ABC transporter permease [Anaerolineaceae bacterium]